MGGSGLAQGRPPVIARAHHGSVSKEQRALVEGGPEGRPAARGGRHLQPRTRHRHGCRGSRRPGRVPALGGLGPAAGGPRGDTRSAPSPPVSSSRSTGGDLVQAAVVTERMRSGAIESLRVPANPLDVLAQRLVAMTALDTWQFDDLLAVVRRAAPFASLPESAFTAVLDMLAGRYPSDAFASCARVVWDRVAGTYRPPRRPAPGRCLWRHHPGPRSVRGLPRRFRPQEGRRPGRRAGRGDGLRVPRGVMSSRWARVRGGSRTSRATASWSRPAPGRAGAGCPSGRATSWAARWNWAVRWARSRARSARWPGTTRGCGCWPRAWMRGRRTTCCLYLGRAAEACSHIPGRPHHRGRAVPGRAGRLAGRRPLPVRRTEVHAPWALALGARLSERYGMDAQVVHADDGIVLRLPDADLMGLDLLDQEPGEGRHRVRQRAGPGRRGRRRLDKGEVDQIVTDQVGGSALFASRFRECAARALLPPRPQPRQAHPAVAAAPASGPAAPGGERVRLIPDRPGGGPRMPPGRLRRPRSRRADGGHRVPRSAPWSRSPPRSRPRSPAPCSSGTSPSSCTRATPRWPSGAPPRSSLDSRLLAELLGQAELRELLDAEVLTELERELQWLTEDRRVKDVEASPTCSGCSAR